MYEQDSTDTVVAVTDCHVMLLCMNIYEPVPADCWQGEYSK
jgi:hypothetical protein